MPNAGGRRKESRSRSIASCNLQHFEKWDTYPADILESKSLSDDDCGTQCQTQLTPLLSDSEKQKEITKRNCGDPSKTPRKVAKKVATCCITILGPPGRSLKILVTLLPEFQERLFRWQTVLLILFSNGDLFQLNRVFTVVPFRF